MSREDNIAAQERLGELVNEGKIDSIDEVFADDVVDHDPAPDQGPGAEGIKTFHRALRAGLPDLEVEVDNLVADDDHVVIAYTVSGTHDGELLGVAPTGKHVSARAIQMARFEHGKIVERWGASNELGILQQIDAA